MKRILFLSIASAFFSCDNEKPGKVTTEKKPEIQSPVTAISFAVVKKHAHDRTAFTEGFLFHEGVLYESTGSPDNPPETRSLIGVLDLKTGVLQKKAEIDRNKYFGEGMVILNGKIYQLTYQTKVGFIYDSKTFKQTGKFTYPSEEGWGMTTDGKYLIMSDGTHRLTWLDPTDFKLIKQVQVTENGYAREHLNELEFINGKIYANIWGTNVIVRINPEDGKVTGTMDISYLAAEARKEYAGSMETNGIAYEPESGHVFVTGKMWPSVYELNLSEK